MKFWEWLLLEYPEDYTLVIIGSEKYIISTGQERIIK
jgi:hypothetical protein